IRLLRAARRPLDPGILLGPRAARRSLMEPEAKYTIVGTAVLIILGVLVAAVLWLRGTGQDRDDKLYKIYFQHQSLQGLEVRSDVRMRGIRGGYVTGVTFSSRRR